MEGHSVSPALKADAVKSSPTKMDEEVTSISQEDAWLVIDAFFEEKGMISQQLGSFDNFIDVQMQAMLDNIMSAYPVVVEPRNQYDPSVQTDVNTLHKFTFQQLSLQKPVHREPDGTVVSLFPNEARKRNLTYKAPLTVDILHEEFTKTYDPLSDSYIVSEEPTSSFVHEHQVLCEVPIMLKSNYCWLRNASERVCADAGECLYDQGGYFIINGSEKVVVALERMANNFVYAFKKAHSKYSWVSEIRSALSEGSAANSGFTVNMCVDTGGRTLNHGQVVATVPHIKAPIPIAILLRALGISSDREILQLCTMDLSDDALTLLLRPSLEDAAPIQTQEQALDFIARRGTTQGAGRPQRVQYAREVLQKELLPHVGTHMSCFRAKAYMIGYMCHRVLMGQLGRIGEDDRDHFGKKRIDLVGPLMTSSFSQLLRNALQMFRKNCQATADRGRMIDVAEALAPAEASLTRGLNYQLATGNWGLDKQGKAVRNGVSQVLNRLTFMATTSQLKRMNTPLARSGKMAKPRQLHNTHWGYVCPAETPEGQAVGLVKNISLMCYITLGSSMTHVEDFLHEWGLVPLQDVDVDRLGEETKVFLNGVWLGNVRNVTQFQRQLIVLRRRADVESEVSVVCDLVNRELKIACDAGRSTRPLFIVRKDTQELRITPEDVRQLRTGELGWSGLIRKGLVEYVDTEEEENAMVAMFVDDLEGAQLAIAAARTEADRRLLEDGRSTSAAEEEAEDLDAATQRSSQSFAAHKDTVAHSGARLVRGEVQGGSAGPLVQGTGVARSGRRDLGRLSASVYCSTYTHCEVHPAMIFSVCASIIPFPDHNQSPRNCYQSAMGKQALGVFCTNFNQRHDTLSNLLCYPQRPMVGTRSMKYLNFRDLPAGINAVVAIMVYSGYNQEDSLVVNQSSLDRGLFRSVFYRTYSAVEDRKKQVTIEVPRPDECLGVKKADYGKLDKDGLAAPGQRVLGNDMLVGMTQVLRDPVEKPGKPLKTKKCCSVAVRPAEWGVVDMAMVTVNSAGDKFVKVKVRTLKIPEPGDKFASRHGQKGTCGITYRMEDMPFSREGVVPDIIMNPHAIPSRMTVGHLIEELLSKCGAVAGGEGDATPFTKLTVRDVADRLHQLGFQRHGNEAMYHGHSGRKIDSLIFIGPVYYQRLKHMVGDKLHSRAKGPVTALCRQPTEGRGREGGLRFGEMERDCMIAHGASKFLKERLFDVSDAYRTHMCRQCGLIAEANLRTGVYRCRACADGGVVAQITLPYAAKMLIQELLSIQIATKMHLEPA